MSKSKAPFHFILGNFKYHNAQAEAGGDLSEVHWLMACLLSFKAVVKGQPKQLAEVKQEIRQAILAVEIAADLGCSVAELNKLVAILVNPWKNKALSSAPAPVFLNPKKALRVRSFG